MLSGFLIIVVAKLDEPGAPSPHPTGGRPCGQWERAGMRSATSCRPKGGRSRACCVSPASLSFLLSEHPFHTFSSSFKTRSGLLSCSFSFSTTKKIPFYFSKKKKKGICSELSNLPDTKMNLTGSVPSLPVFPS